jgi:hypothetical protein
MLVAEDGGTARAAGLCASRLPLSLCFPSDRLRSQAHALLSKTPTSGHCRVAKLASALRSRKVEGRVRQLARFLAGIFVRRCVRADLCARLP